MRLPLKRPTGALPAEEVQALPQRAQAYIAFLEMKFMENLSRLESRQVHIAALEAQIRGNG